MVDIIETQIAAINAANVRKSARYRQARLADLMSNSVRSESPVLERHRKAVQLYLQEAMDAYEEDDNTDLLNSLCKAIEAANKVAQSSRRIKAFVEEAHRA
ncbi:MAG: hypothetical protein ACPGR4_05435 [Paracoccaceae bacterium]